MSRTRRGNLWVGLHIYAMLATVSWLGLLFIDLPGAAFVDTRTTPDLGVSTPYLRDVATALRSDPVYADPALWDVALPDTSALGGDPAVRVVHLPLTPADGSGGDASVTLARLQHLVGDDGVYALVDQNGRCQAISARDGDVAELYCSDVTDVQALRDAAGTAHHGDSERWAAYAYPFIVASGLCVLLHWGLDAIGWLRRRRVPYLPGVR